MRISAGAESTNSFAGLIITTSLICLAAIFPSFSQDSLNLLFPSKDGYASSDTFSGDQKVLIADEGTQTIGWIAYKKQVIDFNSVRSAMLMLHIREIKKKGLCGIFTLMLRVDQPENKVPLSALYFDDMPIAVVPLDSSYTDQIIPIDITELLKSKKFNGIAIRSTNGLSAIFSSKESALPPAIVLTRGPVKPEPVSWFSGASAPDAATGKPGDYFVRTSSGIIYHRLGVTWDSVAMMTIPPQKQAARSPAQKSRRTAKKKTSRISTSKRKQLSL